MAFAVLVQSAAAIGHGETAALASHNRETIDDVPVRSPSRRVLVVEDDPAIREILRLHLELAGFALDEAADGRQALDRIRTTAFALVLLDVMLPGLDGVSLCRALRAAGPNVETPVSC